MERDALDHNIEKPQALKGRHCDWAGHELAQGLPVPEHVDYLTCHQCGCIVFAEMTYAPTAQSKRMSVWVAPQADGMLYNIYSIEEQCQIGAWSHELVCGCEDGCPYELHVLWPSSRREYAKPKTQTGQVERAGTQLPDGADDWLFCATGALTPVWLMAGILDWSATLAAVVVAAWSLLVIGIAAAAWRRERRLRGIAAGSRRGNGRRRSGATTQTNAHAWGPDDAGWMDAAHSDVACVAAHSDVACAGQTECGDGSPARELPQGTSCDAIPQAESVDPPGHHRLQYINSYSEWCREANPDQNLDSYSAWCRASARRQSLPDRRY